MQWLRFHNGHTQEGCELHKEKSRPQFVGGPERCHIHIENDGGILHNSTAVLNMIPIVRLSLIS